MTNRLTVQTLIVSIAILYYNTLALAQQDSLFIIFPDGHQPKKIKKQIDKVRTVNDSSEVFGLLNNWQTLAQSHAYIEASFDSIEGSCNYKAKLHLGPRYVWDSLGIVGVYEHELRKLRIRPEKFTNKAVNLVELNSVFEDIIRYLENHGHPFAAISTQARCSDKGRLSLQLNVQRNNHYRFTSVENRGQAKLKPKFLMPYLGIYKSMEYNEAKINSINKALRQLDYVKESKPLWQEFDTATTSLYLFLEKTKANRLYGVLGLAPSSQTDKRALLTGEVNLRLVNTLGRGEDFVLTWERLEKESQELKTNFIFPYILGWPIGTELGLEIEKQDSSYLRINYQLGAHFYFSANNYFACYLSNESSSILTNTETAKSLGNANYTSSVYGLAYRLQRFDVPTNPAKGFLLDFDISFGTKKFETLANKRQLSFKASQQLFVPLIGKTVLMLSTRQRTLLHELHYRNELFLFGGLRTVRGFDEKSLEASALYTATVELRYLFEAYSNFLLFIDCASYQKKFGHINEKDTPVGFGLGVNLQTKAGIFSINYALGRQKQNPIRINAAVVHLGFTSKF